MPSHLIQGLAFLMLAFFVSVLIVPVMISVAHRKGWFDRPGVRKIHDRPIPRLGGVGIYFATWISWGIFAKLYPNCIPVEAVEPFWALFVASTLIWFLGLYDDLRGANAWKKLSVQLMAAAIVVSYGIDIRLVYNPMIKGDILLGSHVVIWSITVFWIVVVTNAINLIDGLDGLAGGVCFITSVTMFFISKDLGSPHLPFFSLCLAGGCLGFLIFNFSPARIFLGDSGSLFLGFLLACLSVLGTVKRSTAIVMFGPPIILAFPVADTLLAIFRRFLKRAAHNNLASYKSLLSPMALLRRVREIFDADQEHIHHGLLKIGLSHRKAVVILYIVTAVLGLTAYRVALADHLISTVITFGALSLALFWLMRKVKKARIQAGELRQDG